MKECYCNPKELGGAKCHACKDKKSCFERVSDIRHKMLNASKDSPLVPKKSWNDYLGES